MRSGTKSGLGKRKRGFPNDVTLWPKVNGQVTVPYEYDTEACK